MTPVHALMDNDYYLVHTDWHLHIECIDSLICAIRQCVRLDCLWQVLRFGRLLYNLIAMPPLTECDCLIIMKCLHFVLLSA